MCLYVYDEMRQDMGASTEKKVSFFLGLPLILLVGGCIADDIGNYERAERDNFTFTDLEARKRPVWDSPTEYHPYNGDHGTWQKENGSTNNPDGHAPRKFWE